MTYLPPRAHITDQVLEKGQPQACLVRAYDRDTGQLLASTESDKDTGAFALELGRSTLPHAQVVALPDNLAPLQYNALIADWFPIATYPGSDLTTGTWQPSSLVSSSVDGQEAITGIQLQSGKFAAAQKHYLWLRDLAGTWVATTMTAFMDAGAAVTGSTIAQDSIGTLYYAYSGTTDALPYPSLYCMQSNDDGATWTTPVLIRQGTSPQDLVYPRCRAVAASDGSILVLFIDSLGVRTGKSIDGIAWMLDTLASQNATTYSAAETTGMELVATATGVYLAVDSATGETQTPALWVSLDAGATWDSLPDIGLNANSFTVGSFCLTTHGVPTLAYVYTDATSSYPTIGLASLVGSMWRHTALTQVQLDTDYGYPALGVMGNYLVVVAPRSKGAAATLLAWTLDPFDLPSLALPNTTIGNPIGSGFYTGASSLVAIPGNTLRLLIGTDEPVTHMLEYVQDL